MNCNEQAVEIVYEYLQDPSTFMAALGALSVFGVTGKYYSGELQLEEATHATTPKSRERLLGSAMDHFTDVAGMRATDDRSRREPVLRAQSKLRLAQFDTLYATIVRKRMPNQREAFSSFEKTLRVARDISELAERQRAEAHNDQQVVSGYTGVLAEVATLLLGQRFARRQGISEDWWPRITTIAGDRGETTRNIPSTYRSPVQRWDIDILQPEYTHKQITTAYQVQVKSSPLASSCGPTYASNIIKLEAFPDLALSSTERNVSVPILKELDAEMSSPGYSTKAAVRLDQRTEKLLDVIDRAA